MPGLLNLHGHVQDGMPYDAPRLLREVRALMSFAKRSNGR
jgi:hypothetical protein